MSGRPPHQDRRDRKALLAVLAVMPVWIMALPDVTGGFDAWPSPWQLAYLTIFSCAAAGFLHLAALDKKTTGKPADYALAPSGPASAKSGAAKKNAFVTTESVLRGQPGGQAPTSR